MEDSLDVMNENNENIFPPIKYLLIGDINTNKIITEYSCTSNANQIKKEINQIFNKISKSQNKKFNERNKITSKDSIYYYIIEKPNLIYIILVEEDYSEELVFELIDKIQKSEINKMINEETKELNSSGRVELKKIIDIYQKKNLDENDKDNEKDNDNEKKFMKEFTNNINISEKEKDNNLTLNIDDLQTKTDEFLLTNDKKRWSVRGLQIWKNYRTYLVLAFITLIMLIIEIFI